MEGWRSAAGYGVVARARNHLNLLYYSRDYPLLSQMATASRWGLFRSAA